MITKKCLSAALTVLSFASPIFATNQYTIQQLPPEPAQLGEGNIVGFGFSGINGTRAVGAISFQNGGLESNVVTVPFIYDGTSIKSLQLNQNIDSAQPISINSLGTTIGNGWTSVDPFNQIPVEWQNGVLSQLSLGTYGAGSVTSINNLGQIGGYASSINGQSTSDACWWDQNGTLHDLGKFNANAAVVAGINNNGQMLIEALTNNGPNQVLLWDHGTATTITGATGGAVALNNAGHALLSDESSGVPAFSFWNGTTLTQLPTLPGYLTATYFSMNDQDQIVGVSTNLGSSTIPDTAILWDDGTLYDLNTLLPANSGWILTSATNIDDLGDILGYGTFNGQPAAFELTKAFSGSAAIGPTPEPTTLFLLTLAALPLLTRRRRT